MHVPVPFSKISTCHVFDLQTRPQWSCYFISRHAYSLLHHFLRLSRYTFCRAFLTTLNELNDYAGQHEVIAENLTSQIISELSRYLQELKTERKSVRGLFFIVFFPFLVFGFSVFICLPCVLNVSWWRPIVIVREAKQKHYNGVFSLPLLTLFCMSWGHRWINTETPKGWPSSAERDCYRILFMEQSHHSVLLQAYFSLF